MPWVPTKLRIHSPEVPPCGGKKEPFVFESFEKEELAKLELCFPMWCSRWISSIIRSRCSFSAFLLRTMTVSRQEPGSLKPAPTFFPIPIPFWGLFGGMPGGPGSRAKKPMMLRKFTFVVAMAFNFWHFGGFCFDLGLLQRGLNRQRRHFLRHVRALVRSEGQFDTSVVCSAGRRFPELVARLGELSSALTMMGPSSDPYSRSFFGHDVVLEKDNQHLDAGVGTIQELRCQSSCASR